MADQNQTKSAAEIEREQELLLTKKYGGLLKRKQPLIPKTHAYFDSADWALAKEGKADNSQAAATVATEEALPPRTSPATVTAHRAGSKLEEMGGEQPPAAPQ